MALMPQMKSNTIMRQMPIPASAVALFPQEISKTLVADISDSVHKPWLLVSSAYSLNWGRLRWPGLGFPALVMPLDNVAILATIAMETVVSKGLNMAAIKDWFGEEENQLAAKDFDITILRRGEVAQLPFGTICLWSFAPESGAVDTKAAKIPKGKLLVQWVLEKGFDAAAHPAAAREVKHDWTSLQTSHGTAKPWSTFKDKVTEWVHEIKTE